MQAHACLSAAAWQHAVARSLARASGEPGAACARLDKAVSHWEFAGELVEGAEVYLKLRADLGIAALGETGG